MLVNNWNNLLAWIDTKINLGNSEMGRVWTNLGQATAHALHTSIFSRYGVLAYSNCVEHMYQFDDGRCFPNPNVYKLYDYIRHLAPQRYADASKGVNKRMYTWRVHIRTNNPQSNRVCIIFIPDITRTWNPTPPTMRPMSRAEPTMSRIANTIHTKCNQIFGHRIISSASLVGITTADVCTFPC